MEHVLVTGGFGLVGKATVRELAARGHRVTVTDLDTGANRKAAREYDGSAGVSVRWCDITDAATAELLATVAPDAVVHLAAVIPPGCYAAPELARSVNVDGTRHLVDACGQLPTPPRLVLASSVAVYGSRNPHTVTGPVTTGTPPAPVDLYGRHKYAAEQIVRGSDLAAVVLRLGGVMSADMGQGSHPDASYFSGLLPSDGNIHTVDVRDVARAFAAAVRAPVVGRTFLIGGDESHRLQQSDVAALTAAMGLAGVLPEGRPGDPADDNAWFATDWMDTSGAQAALDYQQVSWPGLLAEVRRSAGVRRHVLRLMAPLLRVVLERRAPYRDTPGEYADVWAGVARRWGPEALEA